MAQTIYILAKVSLDLSVIGPIEIGPQQESAFGLGILLVFVLGE